MMALIDPWKFYGPALPLDGPTSVRLDVTFADTEQEQEQAQARLLAMMHGRPSAAQPSTPPDVALGAEGQARDAQGRYQSHATGASSSLASGQGAAAAANEYRWHEQVYSEICRRVLNQEGAAPAGQ